VKAGGRADAIGLRLQSTALGELGLFEVFDRGEVAVDEGRIRQRPAMLGGLQLGRVRRQEVQMDVFRDAEPQARVPAGAVQDEDDLLLGAGAHCCGEAGQLDLEKGNGDGRRQVEECAAGRGMDETDEVAPDEAMTHAGDRSTADRRPDAPQQGFEANAMLVGRPQLDGGVGEGRRDLPQERPDVFLKAACCSSSARAWRGRGTCRLCRSRTR
jgi:hypothetical protein